MKLQLTRKRTEIPGVESFIFKPEEPLTWKAGQYLHYVLHHEPTDNRGSDRWFTVASAPFEEEVMITTRIAAEKGSSFKAALMALQIGDSIEISAVEGDFVVDNSAGEYVFIAGGIGITPFHSILKEADHAGVHLRATLLYANRDANVPYKKELDAFQKNNSDLVVHYVTAPERIDENQIKKLVPDLTKPTFYISGPEPMVKSLAEVIRGMGVTADRIKLDDFPGYPAE
ncbi:MAG: FAD-dependent oxidoreductase [Patescibacteria group bacterium]|nr:FAD-dependent oxidoreductase [Patescibacteria group bacterium]